MFKNIKAKYQIYKLVKDGNPIIANMHLSGMDVSNMTGLALLSNHYEPKLPKLVIK